MPERTKRGEEDRKREDEQMLQGEPVSEALADDNQAPTATFTRDQSVEPANDARRAGQGVENDDTNDR